jgi:AcrR family transcriptional regulator
VPVDAEPTRQKILDAAARLFAERGIYGVSLSEINKAAGQRNASALHYHFGSRQEVLRAILERHIPSIRQRRLDLLTEARVAGDDIRALAEAIVRPITELAQRGWRERAYLQIGAELMTLPDRVEPSIHAVLDETAGPEVLTLLAKELPPMPPAIRLERFEIGTSLIGRAAADRARLLENRAGAGRPLLSEEQFVANLVDMYLGALTAPVTAVTEETRTSA